MPKFKLRQLFDRFPALDRLRIRLLGDFCNHGTTFLDVSFRRIKVMSPGARPFVEEGRPAIYALYHGSMAVLLDFHPRKHICILVSNSRDGEMITSGAHGMGFSTARGSTGRGGARGMLELIKACRAGMSPALLVDGPKGPRFEIKDGVIKLAQVTGMPIIPLGYSARSAWWPNSWDRYTASSWGTPSMTLYGDPLFVKSDAGEKEQEEAYAELDRRMRALHEHADKVWAFSDGKRVGGLIA